MSAQQWYVKTRSGEAGPFSPAELRQAVADKRIVAANLVRLGGSPKWMRADSVRGLIPESREAEVPSIASAASTVPPPVPVVASAPIEVARSGPTRRRSLIASAALICVGSAVGIGVFVLLTRPKVDVAMKMPSTPSASAEVLPDLAGDSAPEPDAAPIPQPSDELPLPVEEEKEVAEVALSSSEVAKLLIPSVVRINAKSDKMSGHGSGFFLEDGATIATNYHVIEGAKSVSIITASGLEVVCPGFVGIFPDHDLAFIRVPVGIVIPKPLKLSPTRSAVGDAVYTYGSPRGFDGTFTDGVLSAYRNGYSGLKGEWMQFTAPVSPGSSGGPVVNDRGLIIGVVAIARIDAQNMNFGLSVTTIRQLYESVMHQESSPWDQLPPPREIPRPPPPADVIAEAIKDANERSTAKVIDNAKHEGRLARLQQLISEANKAHQRIESEKTVLIAERNRIMSKAQGLATRYQQLDVEVAQIRVVIRQIESALKSRQDAANGRPVFINSPFHNDPRTDLELQAEVRRLRTRGEAHTEEANLLTAQLASIDSEARGLKAQILLKQQESNVSAIAIQGFRDEQATLQSMSR